MDKNLQIKLSELEFEVPLDDQFWFEKVRRSVENCSSLDEIKEMAIFLASIATKRNAIIKGLVKSLTSPNHQIIDS